MNDPDYWYKHFEQAKEDLYKTREQLRAWKELAKLRDDLIVCYRFSKLPTENLIDRIQELRERLGES